MMLLQNTDSHVIIWIAIGVLVVLGLLVVNNRARRGAAFGARAVLGVIAVAVINIVLGGFGVFPAVGINALTIAIVAFLGIPGIIMLYGLGYFI